MKSLYATETYLQHYHHVKRQMRRHRAYFAAGVYVPIGPSGRIYRAVAAPVADVPFGRGWESHQHPLKFVMKALVAPPFALIRGTGKHCRATVAFAGGGQELIAYDAANKFVIRMPESTRYSVRYERLRQAYSMSVPTPRFSINAARSVLIEDYVDGVSLGDLPPAERSFAIANVLRAFIRLGQEQGQTAKSYAVISSYVMRASRLGLTTRVSPLRSLQQRLLQWCSRLPMVPSQSDLHPGNVICKGDAFRVVDWPTAEHFVAERPWCYDPMTILIRGKLRETALLFQGSYDHILAPMYKRLWVEGGDLSTIRSFLTLVWLLTHADRKADDGRGDDGFAVALLEDWSKLQGFVR